MPPRFNLGVMFRCQNEPEQIVHSAQKIEATGFDEMWIVEDCFFAGGIASATVALAHTKKIKIGLGIMPAVVRNPAFSAMEIATLARLYPGRFFPGFGHGVGNWMKQIGAFPPSQLTALEEVTTAVRSLLAGDLVDFAGEYVHLDQVKLEFPPQHPPPLSLGVRGPKSLQLAGRVADGTILADYSSDKYIAWALEQIRKGKEKQGRSDAFHRLTVYSFCVVDNNRENALQKMRPLLTQAIASGNISPYLKPLGILDEAQQLLTEGGIMKLEQNMPDEWISKLAIVGTPDECYQAILNLVNAGANTVVLVPMVDDFRTIEVISDSILPLRHLQP